MLLPFKSSYVILRHFIIDEQVGFITQSWLVWRRCLKCNFPHCNIAHEERLYAIHKDHLLPRISELSIQRNLINAYYLDLCPLSPPDSPKASPHPSLTLSQICNPDYQNCNSTSKIINKVPACFKTLNPFFLHPFIEGWILPFNSLTRHFETSTRTIYSSQPSNVPKKYWTSVLLITLNLMNHFGMHFSIKRSPN